MNLFAISGMLTFLASFPLSIFILFRKSSNFTHRIWGCFTLSVAIWGAAVYLIATTKSAATALLWWKLGHIGVIFMPNFLLHFAYNFLNLQRKRLVYASYVISFIILILLYRGLLINHVQFAFNQFYYDGRPPTTIYTIFFLFWISIILYSHLLFYLNINKVFGIKRDQIKYFFLAIASGFSGGITCFLPVFGINIYPFGNLTVPLYPLIATYAIVKYRLMDIKLVVSRATVFIVVYSLVLGIPFWIGIKLLGIGGWLIPVGVMAILATVGPFIYLYFQKKTEERILQEQQRYQNTLRQASAGMGKIKDLKKLLNMIVYVLTHAIQIEHALVYVYDEGQKKYVLGASKKKSSSSQFIENIEKNSPLIDYFLENKNPLILEEIKQKALDYKDLVLTKVEKIISSLNGALIVPIFIDQSLTAIIIMGKKESGKVYTGDDLSVFSILANQTALAIENAIFYEQMKLTHEQLFQAEKMATIGTMADGLSHQINNRFHALGFIAGDALDTIQINKKELSPDKMNEVLAELERAFVRVQDNVVQGGEIVQGLLRYTRKGDAGFTAVDVDAVLKAALEMVQFKIKTDELKIVREYDILTMPKIKANFTQLQEVFFNLIDNGYDAMMQRKNEKKEPGFQPTLIVRVLKEDNYAQVIFEDNGMGVKEEDIHKLFTPFFTTKLSSKKGTGLGLYVIKKIVEDNHGGKVEMVSTYMQGTQMKLRLPIAIG